MPSVRFKLSTGDSYSREVESEEAAVEQVKRFFDRHEDYLRDWIRIDGNAWIARSAVVAVEVWKDSDVEAESKQAAVARVGVTQRRHHPTRPRPRRSGGPRGRLSSTG